MDFMNESEKQRKNIIFTVNRQMKKNIKFMQKPWYFR